MSILKYHIISFAELRNFLIAFGDINPHTYHNEIAFFEIWMMIKILSFQTSIQLLFPSLHGAAVILISRDVRGFI